MDLGLQGKVAAITGGSEGIGRHAFRLCEEGCAWQSARREDVPDNARRSPQRPEEVCRAGRCHNPADCAQFVLQTIERRTPRHPGQQRRRSLAMPFEQAADGSGKGISSEVVWGYPLHAARHSPYARKGGRIINMTAIAANNRRRGRSTSVTRAAGINLTKALANEYAPTTPGHTICLGV
jgi:NAD(P)-dependent dehydrogenase (short-subunit alcohol dehydrogenase family)